MSAPAFGEDWGDYWKNYAEALAHPLAADGQIGRFTDNREVLGTYAEEWVRETVASMLPSYRVSTGAIISASDRQRGSWGEKIPQCDIIIWDPTELPALFEKGSFALVPNFSVRGLIEVKRSAKRVELLDQLKIRQKRIPPKHRSFCFGVVIGHGRPLFDLEVRPDWLKPFLNELEPQPRMTRLFDRPLGKDIGRRHVDQDGLMAFVYFLAQRAGHFEGVSGPPASQEPDVAKEIDNLRRELGRLQVQIMKLGEK